MYTISYFYIDIHQIAMNLIRNKVSTVDVKQGQGDRPVEIITTPPDHLVAVVLAETPPAKLKPSKAISLQETSKGMSTTPAAKKREDMAKKNVYSPPEGATERSPRSGR